MIGIDQYGSVYRIKGKYPRKELLHSCCATHASKMYHDRKDAKGQWRVEHIGYIIRGYWITLYSPWRQEA